MCRPPGTNGAFICCWLNLEIIFSILSTRNYLPLEVRFKLQDRWNCGTIYWSKASNWEGCLFWQEKGRLLSQYCQFFPAKSRSTCSRGYYLLLKCPILLRTCEGQGRKMEPAITREKSFCFCFSIEWQSIPLVRYTSDSQKRMILIPGCWHLIFSSQPWSCIATLANIFWLKSHQMSSWFRYRTETSTLIAWFRELSALLFWFRWLTCLQSEEPFLKSSEFQVNHSKFL